MRVSDMSARTFAILNACQTYIYYIKYYPND